MREPSVTVSSAARVALPAVLGFAPVFGLAAANGGFFPTEWGWPALALLLVAAVALVVRDDLRVDRLQLLMLVLLAALAAWVALSALWSPTATLPLLEAERAVLYLAAAAAVFLTSSRASARPLAAGVLLACVAVSAWALGGRLFPRSAPAPEGLGGYRLTGPVGYWNGLGLLAVIGILLAAGFALHESTRAARAAAAAAAVVLLPTLVFTFSRGSWLALAAGAAALLVLERDRLRLAPRLALALPAAAAAALAAAVSPALTRPGSSLADASREGHRLALALVLLAAVAAGLSLVADRVPPPRLGRRGRRRLLAAALLVALVALVAVAASAVRTDVPAGGSLNRRLLSASGTGRGDYWHVAWQETRAHPALGGGAGSFRRWWLQRRPNAFGALDAHELYLETLAELGPVGLLVLAAALGVPFIALVRRRAAPPGAACGAAYVAFLVHAALDWDWELTAAGLAGLLCGTSVLVSTGRADVPVGRRARAAALAVALALVAFVFVLHVGNVSLAASESALERNDPAAAARHARRAKAWQPWSTQPLLALGEARLAAGEPEAAAAAFRSATRRDPADWEPWYQLALATTGRERDRALAEAARLNPRSPELASLDKRGEQD